MKIIIENEIQRALTECKPSKIAVAYIGADWSKFISDINYLDAIIVSPTLGTNPLAIAELIKTIGWDKVYFLDELHAKLYIGTYSAIIGSANLTKNGLNGDRLFEICVEIKSNEKIKEINITFDKILKKAISKYPTIESKKKRLKDLDKIWKTAISQQVISTQNNRIPLLSDFELLGDDHFYVLWYQPIDCDYSEDVKSMQSLIYDDIHFSANDNVEKNKWALIWRITDSYTPHSEKPYWMYIHEIFDGGIINDGYEYPKCAIQRKDLDTPPVPFKITKEVEIALKQSVQEKEISKYLIQEGQIFNLSYSLKGIKLLIDKMKKISSEILI